MIVQIICLLFAIICTLATWQAEGFSEARAYAAATYIIVAIMAATMELKK